MTPFFIATGILLFWLYLFIRGLLGLRRTPLPRPGVHPGRVTAYVPARNEAEVIRACVTGLLAQPLEKVVVIDDGSTDDTAAQAALPDPKLVVEEGIGPQPGEFGKPAALRLGVARHPPATEWLLFVDADVILAPGALGALLAQGETADLVTVLPQQTLTTAWEKIVMPAVGALILARYPPPRVNDSSDPLAFANGQVILIRKATYEAIGGHGAVVDQVLEDVRLAEKVKGQGGRIKVVDGRYLAQTRMYQNWAELSEGWSKNLYRLMGPQFWLWVIFSLFVGWLGPAAWLLGPLGAVVWVLTVVMQMILRQKGGAPALWAPLAPLGATLAAYLLLKSAYLHRAQKIAWKGRVY